jgi:hypothetical protein
MSKVSAVAKLQGKIAQEGLGQTILVFAADYNDPQNKEWAKYTPSFSTTMTVLDTVAEKFELEKTYLVTFEERDAH